MRILFLTLGAPYPPDSGVKLRDYHLLRQIARQHEVTVFSLLYSEAEIAPLQCLRQFCADVDYVVMRPHSFTEQIWQLPLHLLRQRPLATYPFFYDEMAQKIRRIITERAINLMELEHSFLAPYVEAVPREANCKTILSLHNLGVRQYGSMRSLKMSLPEKGLFWLKWLTMLGWETQVARRFDRVIAVSDLEANLLLRANPKLNISVIENGCDTRACQPLPEATDSDTMLYVGTLGYPPNVDAVLNFCGTALPLIQRQLPTVRLVVVGHRPPPEIQRLAAQGQVIVTGSVDDVIPYYQQARVCVVPLRAGGGTRLKILEAMALGRPVVSTSLGCEGLKVRDREHLLIADTPAEFAGQVIELLNNAELRRRLSIRARELVESAYDWSVIGRQLLQVYDEVLNSRKHLNG